MHKIEIETKPNGAGRNWLEVGLFATDDFGDKQWQPSPDRYPDRDSRLKVRREWDGRGNSQRIRWTIVIPDDYPLVIYQRSGDKRPNWDVQDTVVWQPGTAEKPVTITLMPSVWRSIVAALPAGLAAKIQDQI